MTSTINKPLATIALMSRFNWFDVSSEDTTGKTAHFCATGIDLREFDIVRFNRQFATPQYSDDKIIDAIAESDNKFSLLSKSGTVYTVEASNKVLADCSTASGSKDDPASLIDWHRSQIDDAGNMLVVLDLRKMGRISGIEHLDIKCFMDAYLGGLARSKQVCRTIYVEAADDEKITIGLYNLENEEKMTAKNCIWYTLTDDEEEKLKRLLDAAKAELEVIPLF